MRNGGTPTPDLGWEVPDEQKTRVELLGARYSRWLNRAPKPWSVREDGVALEGSQRWRDKKHCLLHFDDNMDQILEFRQHGSNFDIFDDNIHRNFSFLTTTWIVIRNFRRQEGSKSDFFDHNMHRNFFTTIRSKFEFFDDNSH